MATPIDPLALERLRTSLRTRHAGIVDEIRKLNEAVPGAGPVSLVGLEGSVGTLTQVIHASRLHRLGVQLVALEHALDRLDQNEFGLCGDCGRFIGLERLSGLPFARHCRACQRKADGRGAGVRVVALSQGRRARPGRGESATPRSA